jgi:hypothetical protein
MTDRRIHLSFASPEKSVEQVMTVDAALALMEQHVRPSELTDAVTYLEMGRMAEGYYKGSGWSVLFRVVDPTEGHRPED